MNRPSPTESSLADLRTQRHAQWLRDLQLSLQELVEPSLERPDQIYLFGSRARGDWDGLSDTDLLVVAANKHLAETWADQVLDSGLAEDVIGLDREAWAQLPKSTSVVWRNAAKVAIPLLAERP
ncbi:nucleotidyltransferase domain-containing protein [Synechococcus sp. SYN20]|uniref:nucleotidyltransferase domain-containing protein n=1 Tax=Synechococcus sp. SYN20 TaxID=1050714 RepID=UPI001648EC05|nr:nucleotidyltransferase domain-containing protein [Synechococcus sp. SYN20]